MAKKKAVGKKKESIDELKKKLKKAKKEIKNLKGEINKKRNQLLRTMADFQNYQKRVEREMKEGIEKSKGEIISKFLDVYENMKIACENRLSKKGLKMITSQFEKLLEEEGIEEIEAVGKKFDHGLHHAISIIESNEYDDGTIVKEIKKGYLIDGKLLRPSLVMVAKNRGD
jgi:molecular chaperone GrpE